MRLDPDRILFRKADGNLMSWENQGFLHLDEQHEAILPLFKMIIEDKETHTEGYTIDGMHRRVGYIIKDEGILRRQQVKTMTSITVKNSDTIKEQIVILS